jgi:hypothetical protein
MSNRIAEASMFQFSPTGPVCVHEPSKAQLWCIEFQCTPAQLELAVRAVGTDPVTVRRELAALWRGSDAKVRAE